jgi:hypothetical protein
VGALSATASVHGGFSSPVYPDPVNLEFSGRMWFWKGPAPWHFITVPDEELDVGDTVAVTLTLDM